MHVNYLSAEVLDVFFKIRPELTGERTLGCVYVCFSSRAGPSSQVNKLNLHVSE